MKTAVCSFCQQSTINYYTHTLYGHRTQPICAPCYEDWARRASHTILSFEPDLTQINAYRKRIRTSARHRSQSNRTHPPGIIANPACTLLPPPKERPKHD